MDIGYDGETAMWVLCVYNKFHGISNGSWYLESLWYEA